MRRLSKGSITSCRSSRRSRISACCRASSPSTAGELTPTMKVKRKSVEQNWLGGDRRDLPGIDRRRPGSTRATGGRPRRLGEQPVSLLMVKPPKTAAATAARLAICRAARHSEWSARRWFSNAKARSSNTIAVTTIGSNGMPARTMSRGNFSPRAGCSAMRMEDASVRRIRCTYQLSTRNAGRTEKTRSPRSAYIYLSSVAPSARVPVRPSELVRAQDPLHVPALDQKRGDAQ